MISRVLLAVALLGGTAGNVIGGDWTDYGWDDAFNDEGEWTRGPLHGYVYLIRNTGPTEEPQYTEPVKLTAEGDPIDVYGMPSPNLATVDWDGDGVRELLVGAEDGFFYYLAKPLDTEPI